MGKCKPRAICISTFLRGFFERLRQKCRLLSEAFEHDECRIFGASENIVSGREIMLFDYFVAEVCKTDGLVSRIRKTFRLPRDVFVLASQRCLLQPISSKHTFVHFVSSVS